MRRWFVGMTALGLACGGDSSGPGATSVTGVAGDNQTASRGSTLPVPLSFTALGSDGLPIAGVSVTWTATPTNGASFAPPTTTTDANGIASTNVTLGSALGTITMQASLNGVPPVVYHATSTDPCANFTSYSIGDSVNAALTSGDCLRGGNPGWYYDYYLVNFPAPAQQNIRVKMHGLGAFDDPFIDYYTFANGTVQQIVAFDDDSILGQEGARNSQLDIIFPGDTTFAIGANSFAPFTTGNYTLTSENRAQAMNGCRAVWLTRGISVTDSLKATDCADSSATPKYYEVGRMVVFAGTVLTLNMRSSTLNPLLALYRLDPGQNYARSLVASNDDSLPGTNTNAFIQYTVAASSFYDIVIGTSTGGEIGDYTFAVSSSTPPAPYRPGSAPKASSWDGWWRDVGLPKRSTP
jgi:hypothetical protein